MKRRFSILAALTIALAMIAAGCLDQFSEAAIAAANQEAFAYSAASLGAIMETLSDEADATEADQNTNQNTNQNNTAPESRVNDVKYYINLLEGYLSGKPVKITMGQSSVKGYKYNITITVICFDDSTTVYSLDYNEIAKNTLDEAEAEFEEVAKEDDAEPEVSNVLPDDNDTADNNADVNNDNEQSNANTDRVKKASVWLIRGILTVTKSNNTLSSNTAASRVRTFKVSGVKRRNNGTFSIKLRAVLSNSTHAVISFFVNAGKFEISYLIVRDGKIIHKGVLVINLKNSTYRVQVSDGSNTKNYKFKADENADRKQIKITPEENPEEEFVARPEKNSEGKNNYNFERNNTK